MVKKTKIPGVPKSKRGSKNRRVPSHTSTEKKIKTEDQTIDPNKYQIDQIREKIDLLESQVNPQNTQQAVLDTYQQMFNYLYNLSDDFNDIKLINTALNNNYNVNALLIQYIKSFLSSENNEIKEKIINKVADLYDNFNGSPFPQYYKLRYLNYRNNLTTKIIQFPFFSKMRVIYPLLVVLSDLEYLVRPIINIVIFALKLLSLAIKSIYYGLKGLFKICTDPIKTGSILSQGTRFISQQLSQLTRNPKPDYLTKEQHNINKAALAIQYVLFKTHQNMVKSLKNQSKWKANKKILDLQACRSLASNILLQSPLSSDYRRNYLMSNQVKYWSRKYVLNDASYDQKSIIQAMRNYLDQTTQQSPTPLPSDNFTHNDNKIRLKTAAQPEKHIPTENDDNRPKN